ncbi:MAG: FecR family protein [Bacteroidota bacterium]
MDKIIFKKLSGESLSREEIDTLEQWLVADSKNRKTYFQLRMAYQTRDKSEITESKNELWKELSQSMSAKDQTSNKKVLLRWAASIILMVAIGSMIYYYSGTQDNQLTQETIINLTERSTNRGQKRSITLPDGTKVKLNSKSKLICPDLFETERRVKIEGEAFFEVTKSTMPFIVEAGDIEVRVLGTSFNVNTYPTNKISVAVATGKVNVAANTKDLAIQKDLLPGQQVTYKYGEPMLEVSDYDVQAVLGWKDNLLVFKESNFVDVIKDLNNWYGVTFIIDDEIDFDKTFNGAYINPALPEVMESLAHLYSFKYEINDEQVNIRQ